MQPWILQLGSLQVPTYMFMLALGLTLAIPVLIADGRKEGLGERLMLDWAIGAVPFVFLGARLLHALWERPDYYLQRPLEVLSPQGGFVFYGGVMGAALWTWIFCRWRGVSFWQLGDSIAPAGAFCIPFGRMGCLGAGCCYGSPALLGEDTVLPWAVRYYRRGMVPEPLLGLPLHPSPLYEALGAVGLLLFLRWRQRRPRRLGQIGMGFLGGYALLRVGTSLTRADPERGLLWGWLPPSMLLALTLLAAYPLVLRRLPPHPGAAHEPA